MFLTFFSIRTIVFMTQLTMIHSLMTTTSIRRNLLLSKHQRWNYHYALLSSSSSRLYNNPNLAPRSAASSSPLQRHWRRRYYHTTDSSPSSLYSKSSNNNSDGNTTTISLHIETMEEMEEIGALLAVISKPPDVFFLDGDLGAGKTTFSRGFIQCKLGQIPESDDEEKEGEEDDGEDIGIRVTSPTYLLSNTYTYTPIDDIDAGSSSSSSRNSIDIHHIDLYRLPGTSSDEFYPLHLDHVFKECISLVEWPSRLFPFPELMPPKSNLLKVNLSIIPSTDERIMQLTIPTESTSWQNRIEKLIDEEMLDDLLIDDDEEE